MVQHPEEYKWSSYGENAGGNLTWLVPHEEYLRLGRDVSSRSYAYRELFRYTLKQEDLHKFRRSIHYCQPLGDDRFSELIEQKYGIKVGQASSGRPRKHDEVVKK